jgi:hypothetical protein
VLAGALGFSRANELALQTIAIKPIKLIIFIFFAFFMTASCFLALIARILGESGVIFVGLRFLPSLTNATLRGKRGHRWPHLTFRRGRREK